MQFNAQPINKANNISINIFFLFENFNCQVNPSFMHPRISQVSVNWRNKLIHIFLGTINWTAWNYWYSMQISKWRVRRQTAWNYSYLHLLIWHYIFSILNMNLTIHSSNTQRTIRSIFLSHSICHDYNNLTAAVRILRKKLSWLNFGIKFKLKTSLLKDPLKTF